jgi:putative spermidine/putrescine transport system substrate-binding protein
VFAGCGSSDDDSSSATGTGSSTGASKDLTGPITYVGWGGDYQAAQKKAWLDPWSAKTGVKVLEDSPTDYAKIQTQVQSGKVFWDVVDVESFRSCDVYEKIDYSQVNKADFPAPITSPCGVPIIQYSYVLTYSNKFKDDPPTSWADFFDLKKYPGKRGVANYPQSAQLEAALLADGVPKDQLYPLDLDKAFDKLDTIKDDIVFYASGTEQQQQMASNEVVMTVVWSARVATAVDEGAEFTPMWNDNIATSEQLRIPKGAEHQDSSQSLIAYATSPEPQAAFGELYPYAPANSQAKPNYTKQQEAYLLTNPEIKAKTIYQDNKWWEQNFDEAQTRWTEWTQG